MEARLRTFNFKKTKTQYKRFLDFFGNLFFTYCFIIGLALIVFSSVTVECEVVGSSMVPTLNDYSAIEKKKDTVFINTKDRDFCYGDIVVCETDSDPIIKRIIGLPEDVIDIVLVDNEYKVQRNGKILEEDYINIDKTLMDDDINKNGNYSTYQKFQMLKKIKPYLFNNDEKLVVPSDSIFVLGDNRHVSVDSATIGTFSFDKINGKVELIKYADESEFSFYWSYIVDGKFVRTIINIF